MTEGGSLSIDGGATFDDIYALQDGGVLKAFELATTGSTGTISFDTVNFDNTMSEFA